MASRPAASHPAKASSKMKLTDLCTDVLKLIFDVVENNDLHCLRQSCKVICAAVHGHWLEAWIWHQRVPVARRKALMNFKRVTATNHLVSEIRSVSFVLHEDHEMKPDRIATVAQKEESHKDSQKGWLKVAVDQLFTEHYCQPLDQALLVSVLMDLKVNEQAKIAVELHSDEWLHQQLHMGETEEEWDRTFPVTSDRAHELVYAFQCAKTCPDAFSLDDDAALCKDKLALQDIFSLEIFSSNIKCMCYIARCDRLGMGFGDNADRAGPLTILGATDNLDYLEVSAPLSDHEDDQEGEPFAKYLALCRQVITANTSTSLRSLVLNGLHVSSKDLAKIIQRCSKSLRYVGLSDVVLQGSGTWVDVLEQLKECQQLKVLDLIDCTTEGAVREHRRFTFLLDQSEFSFDTCEDVQKGIEKSLEYLGSS